MNNLPPTILQALRPCMPNGLTQAELVEVDRQVQVWKDTYHQRNDAQALGLQIAQQHRDDGRAA